MYGDFPAKYTVYTPYIYMVLANPRKKTEGRHRHRKLTACAQILVTSALLAACVWLANTNGIYVLS
jgi:hypothetical protein